MTSYTTRLAKQIRERNFTKEERREQRDAKSQFMVSGEDGGYSVYHPTRGWRHVSALRVAAQMKMQRLLAGSDTVRPPRDRRRKLYRADVMPVPEGHQTRQQRRHAARKGEVA